MLIRINGGHSGIKEYLERGQKQDRFFTRDELDHRLILDGNLSVTHAIIESMTTKHDRYFHITLSFKEDYVDQDILSKISQEFKEYFLHSYTDDEINYYAEAHLPKIKHYTSVKDNTPIDRKPHIHIVIPQLNLFTATSFNPVIQNIIKYIDAFQEHVNAKYGFESPKDNPRANLHDSGEVISRYKGDIFNNQGKEDKEAILKLTLDNNPTSLDKLHALLLGNGYIVRIRNQADKANCYLNVKKVGDQKGINLKEFVFREDFLKLSPQDKLTQLIPDTGPVHNKYLQPTAPKKINPNLTAVIQEWKTIKALEHRFINRSASKTERHKYKQFTHAGKIAYLQQKHDNYYKTYHEYLNFLEGAAHDRDHRTTINDVTNIIRSNDTIINDLKTSITGVRDIKGSYNTNFLRQSITRASQERHRAYLSNGQANEQHAAKDSVVTELLEQQLDCDKQQTFKTHLSELNAKLHANLLLELVSKTHGINPELYPMTKNSFGIDRIKCGESNLSVVDFCTKELNLSFKETVQLLDNAYNMQVNLQQDNSSTPQQDLYLKEEYQAWYKLYRAARLQNLKNCTNKTKSMRESILAEHRGKIKLLRDNKHMPSLKRAQQISILKASQVIALKALTTAKFEEQQQIREAFNLEMHTAYRKFLAEKANLGDEIALKELRRIRVSLDKAASNHQSNSFNCIDYYNEFRLNITYEIDTHGNICYKLDNKTIIKDTGRKLEVLQNTEDNLKLTLDSVVKLL